MADEKKKDDAMVSEVKLVTKEELEKLVKQAETEAKKEPRK